MLRVYPYWGLRAENARGVRRLLCWLFPVHFLSVLKSELYLLWVRANAWRYANRFEDERDLLVNVGPGDTGRVGWVNVDIRAYANTNCIVDARKRLPFADKSVRGIFTEHFLEHLEYTQEIPRFLSECARVLADGGVLRIIVPDAEKYMRAYVNGGWSELAHIRPLTEDRRDYYFKDCSYNTRMELINVVFRQGTDHKVALDHETLEFLLKRYGFNTVERREFGVSAMPELCLDQEVRASESLYIEGIKGPTTREPGVGQ